MYCHLRTHSYYSFLEGLPSPSDLANAAAACGMTALGLTDHLSLTGAVSFYQACREVGIQPVLGLEVDLGLPFSLSPFPAPEITGRIALLAMDFAGWRSLCRLSSHLLTAQGNNQQNSCSLEDLQKNADGLICLTGGCTGPAQRLLEYPQGEGEVHKLLGRLSEIFPERLYVELNQQVGSDQLHNQSLINLSSRLGLPILAAHAVYYSRNEQAALQRTVSAIRNVCPLTRLPDQAAAPTEAWFRSPEAMSQAFADRPEALAASLEIASRCKLELPLGQLHYPEISLPDGLTAIELLRNKAEAGASRLYGRITPKIRQRLDSELAVIAARGYEKIFLIAEEMLSFARQNGILAASRGSASSSLVAHCTGITTPDPLTLDLYFERFLNPARATPPDIDTDFCSRRRDEVIQHLFETYQPERVAMIGTINTLRTRSALSEVAKAHGFKPAEIRALSKRLPSRGWDSPQTSPQPDEPGGTPSMPVQTGEAYRQDREDSPYKELIAQYGHDPRYAVVLREAAALLGSPHHLSIHPGGVVIAPGPMVDFVPVTRSGGKGITITQFELDDVEQIGLIKLDLLGIRGLTVLGDVTGHIFSWRRKEFNYPLDVLESIPSSDPETTAIVSTGRTIGCFQIESPGMRATLRDIQARDTDDIMAALALYRPGPLKGGLRDAFVRRHNNKEAVTHIHPALTGLLQDTYGVILYQEQVLRIAHDMAGLSLAEADLLRRAMSHFDPGRQMQILKEKFITGAEANSGIPPETGSRIWDMMAAFAGYGFPKAHAASYAQVAWRSAWCKAHYPAEFIAAVLANWGGYYSQSVYLNEARRLGLKIRPPHVNHSLSQFSVAYPQGEPVLYMGLDQVRGLSHRTQERIMRLRPYHNLTEFLMKVDPRRQEAANLIQIGAFEGIGIIPEMINQLSGGLPRPGQLSLFVMAPTAIEDWSIEKKVEAQQHLLGASLEAHPLELHEQAIAETGAVNTIEAAAQRGETVRVVGMRQTINRSMTEQGEWMAFMTLEDLEGMLDIVLFPAVYQRSRSIINNPASPLVVEGTIELDSNTGEPVLRAQQIWRLK